MAAVAGPQAPAGSSESPRRGPCLPGGSSACSGTRPWGGLGERLPLDHLGRRLPVRVTRHNRGRSAGRDAAFLEFARSLWSNIKENDGYPISIEKMYEDFSKAMDYAKQSKEKFLEANDLETEDTGSREAAAEMRKLAKQIKDIYIPSVKEMAINQGINLN